MFKVIVFLKRKRGLPRDKFIEYYENVHQKLVRDILPPILDYRRNYPIPNDPLAFSGKFDDAKNFSSDAPSNPTDDFDVITEISFHDRSGFEELIKALRESPAGKRIAEDEIQFLEREGNRVMIVEEFVSDPV